MAIEDRFEHTMRVVRVQATGSNIEGQRDEQEILSAPVDCLLTNAPGDAQPSEVGRRVVTTPTLLYAPVHTGSGAAVSLRAGDSVEVTAPLVHQSEGLPDPCRYNVEGRPQPLSRPGSSPMGYNATLTLVQD